MRDQQTAVGVYDGAAIERRRRQIDAQGFDLLQHGFRRPAGGQAEQHARLTQRTDRIDGALTEAVIGQQQCAVHVTEQKADGLLRFVTHPRLCQTRPSRVSRSSAAAGPSSPAA
ncbi:hypothetical protein D3C84_1022730 [compost metagenome]